MFRSKKSVMGALMTLSFVLVASAAAGCKNPADEVPKATVAEPAAPAAPEAPAAAPAAPAAPAAEEKKAEAAGSGAAAAPAASGTESLAIVPDMSKIGWTGSKVTGSHDGGFTDFKGSIGFDAAAPEKSTIEVTINTESIFSDAEKLTGHLKSPDFFDTAQFPVSTFKSTSIAVGGPDGATHTITGELTLRGVTKAISFPAKIEVTAETVTATADFAINRKDFNIVYTGKPDDLIRDEVVLRLQISAKRGG